MAVKLGDAQTKRKTTGRLYLKRTGETNYIDFGNVAMHKLDPQVERVEHLKSAGGFNTVDLNQPKTINFKCVFELDEHTNELEKLRMLATQGADTTQGSGNVVAESLTTNSKKGRTYFAAAEGLSAVVVKVSGVTKTLGTDYTVDLGSGAVTITPDSPGIADGSTVTIDYTKAQVTRENFTALKELRVTGDVKYLEADQFSDVPRAIYEATGQIFVTGWGDNNGEYTKTTVEFVPSTAPTIKTRKD
jgi:hypothetical protein